MLFLDKMYSEKNTIFLNDFLGNVLNFYFPDELYMWSK